MKAYSCHSEECAASMFEMIWSHVTSWPKCPSVVNNDIFFLQVTRWSTHGEGPLIVIVILRQLL